MCYFDPHNPLKKMPQLTTNLVMSTALFINIFMCLLYFTINLFINNINLLKYQEFTPI
jgi:hypothetical protein